MYVIKLTENKELCTTIQSTIYVNENNADVLTILVPHQFEDLLLSDCTASIHYILPNSIGKAEFLVQDKELYKGYLQYHLPVHTKLTSIVGTVELWLVFVDGVKEIVMKTGSAFLEISERKNIADYLHPDTLDQIDRLTLDVDRLRKTKADNIRLQDDEIQLTAEGNFIGDGISTGNIKPIIDFDQTGGDPE